MDRSCMAPPGKPGGVLRNGLRFEAEPRDRPRRPDSSWTNATTARGWDPARPDATCSTCSATPAVSRCTPPPVGRVSVTSVDLSRPAIEATDRNFALNRNLPAVARCQHRGLAVDAFEALETMAREGRRFGVVVLGHPCLPSPAAQVEPALRAYARLTHLGLSGAGARRHPGAGLVLQPRARRIVLRLRRRCRPSRRPPPVQRRDHGPRPGPPRTVRGWTIPEVPVRDGSLSRPRVGICRIA